ncbi:zinc ribbon domain-containing protein [Chitinophaga filiformis]|uniref:Zinc ribbon domain-containing protein n=1 Tax=Chitinophaga filiformis TaxID=104663 RepID=A0ABY4HTY3_CHIFI|nr:zinc ribbon domain-containing protein [Chitinophaga filiformis]UPK67249.1 zinc ribbon domain-containing protein [Chitinophaga filiformis]
MASTNFCQSCSMPIDDPAMAGTEKNGAPSKEYCKYCYQQGAFTTPNMTLDEMRTVVKTEMEKRHIGQEIINLAVNTLPNLKRWRNSNN